MKDKDFKGINSMQLHTIAMMCMLVDHIWNIFGSQEQGWMNCIGRIAFPIYAFMIVEGYFKTKNKRRFFLRLFALAVISEIPFNLMIANSWIYPLAQNVIWTLLIGVSLVHFNELFKEKHIVIRIALGLLSIEIAKIAGVLSLVDYHYAGIYTVLVFYFLRGKNRINFILQLLFLVVINKGLLGGYVYEFDFGTYFIKIPRQAFALLALIPIWLYNSEQGECNKQQKVIYRLFYPVHMLVLGLIRILLGVIL